MSTDSRPVPVRFFPAARVGLAVGAVVAIVSAVSLRHAQPAAPVSDRGPTLVIDDIRKVRGPVLINVWLQGCPDCMPAFDAWREMRSRNAFGNVDVVNVAYGSATADFAKRYDVDDHLMFDADGSKVVHPLGISTFTTLIFDAHGQLAFTGRPDSPDFETHVNAAWFAARRVQ